MGDPEWFDAKIAGLWVWGACCWIGSGWCSGLGPWSHVDGRFVKAGDAGRGVNKKLPHLGDAGRGVNKKRGVDGLAAWMRELSLRLRRVRVACGDWSRVTGDSVLWPSGGVCGVFLDPPYSHAVRDGNLYAVESADAGEQARAWAIERGDNPRLRIALCGYDNEHGGHMPDGWRAVPWKAIGGYGSQGTGEARDNSAREVIWFSPHCLGAAHVQRALF